MTDYINLACSALEVANGAQANYTVVRDTLHTNPLARMGITNASSNQIRVKKTASGSTGSLQITTVRSSGATVQCSAIADNTNWQVVSVTPPPADVAGLTQLILKCRTGNALARSIDGVVVMICPGRLRGTSLDRSLRSGRGGGQAR